MFRRPAVALSAVFVVLVSFAACSGKKAGESGPPPSSKLKVTTVTVSGPGASKADSSKQQTAEAAAAPVATYYNGAYFDLRLPTDDYKAAFTGFTPTIAAQAQGPQKDTATLGDVGGQLKSLRAESIAATVSLYGDADGGVGQGVVHANVQGEGVLQDGGTMSLTHIDDFYVVKTGANWIVTGYVIAQKIDAPPAPASDSTATATPGASPTLSTAAASSSSPSASSTKKSTPTPTSTRKK